MSLSSNPKNRGNLLREYKLLHLNFFNKSLCNIKILDYDKSKVKVDGGIYELQCK